MKIVHITVFQRMLVILFLAAMLVGCESQQEAYKRGYKKGYVQGFEKGEKKGYADGTKAFVEDSWLPTLGGALIGLLFLLAFGLLCIVLRSVLRRTLKSAEYNLKKIQTQRFIENAGTNMNRVHLSESPLPALQDLESRIIEWGETDLIGEMGHVNQSIKNNYEKAVMKYKPEMDQMKDRMIEIEHEVRLALIDDKKDQYRAMQESIAEDKRIRKQEKINLFERLKSLFH